MIAMKLAAACVLIMGATAGRWLGSDQPGAAAPQASQTDAQEAMPPPAADDVSVRRDGSDDPAPGGGDTDSVQVDSPVSQETPAWLLGRWCAGSNYRFTILEDDEVRLHDGTRHPLEMRHWGAERAIIVAVMPGASWTQELGTFNPAEGERTFRTPYLISDPLQRC